MEIHYDKERMKKEADNLENYLDILERFIIIEGITKEQYDAAVKKVKKLIKHLRKGHGEKVYEPERYLEVNMYDEQY